MRRMRSLVWLSVLLALTVLLTGCLGSSSGGSKRGVTTVEGTLNNEFGHPVKGAIVTVGGVIGKTGTDGSFRLTGVPSGAQTLAVTGTGYVGREFAVQVVAKRANRVSDSETTGTAIVRTVHSTTKDQIQMSSTVAQATTPHTSCFACHTRTAGTPSNPAFLKANAQSLCDAPGCHVAPSGGPWEHPLAHLDGTKVKPEGELAVYDKITCLRCHLSHAGSGGTLTPGFPASPTTSTYTTYCTACHNSAQPGNTFNPTTHNPGSTCTTCHANNGLASCPHGACSRPESGCHQPSGTMNLGAAHKALGCATCHDTAGSNPNLLRTTTSNALCAQAGCHSGKVPPLTQHAAAGCDGCHSIHGTTTTPDAKCYASCHTAVRGEQMAGASAHDLSCATCHNGHAVTATQKVTNPFTKAAYPYSYSNSGPFCLLCHGFGADYMGAEEVAGGAPAVEKWPGAVNITPELLSFTTRVTTFWIGLRFASEGGASGPWYDYNMNGHYAHWGNEYVASPPPGWPYTDTPDPCILCHGVHAGQDPKLIRPASGIHPDWTLYAPDHKYDCHYSCHGPAPSLAASFLTTASSDKERTIEATIARRAGGIKLKKSAKK